MRSKVLVVLALPLLYFGGLIAGGTVKASSGVQPLRVAYTRFAFLTPTTMGTWESVASVAVTATHQP